MAERQRVLPPENRGGVMSPYAGKVYDNDALQILQQAMNMSWRELRASGDWEVYGRNHSAARDRLAERILRLAASGERNPDSLKAYALAGLRGDRFLARALLSAH
jgi:hypothetical protein